MIWKAETGRLCLNTQVFHVGVIRRFYDVLHWYLLPNVRQGCSSSVIFCHRAYRS